MHPAYLFLQNKADFIGMNNAYKWLALSKFAKLLIILYRLNMLQNSRRLFFFLFSLTCIKYISNSYDEFKTTSSNATKSSCPFSDPDLNSSKDPHLSCPYRKSKKKKLTLFYYNINYFW